MSKIPVMLSSNGLHRPPRRRRSLTALASATLVLTGTAVVGIGAPALADEVAPTVTANQAWLQGDPTDSPALLFEVQFSEPVTGFAAEDVTLSGTANASVVTVRTDDSGLHWAQVSGMATYGTVSISVPAGAATDMNGNPNAASTSIDNTVTYARDPIAPEVTINQSPTQSDPSEWAVLLFDVEFSEPVSDFESGDVAISGTANATTATVIPIEPFAYSIEVSGMTHSGTVTVTVPAGAAFDQSGNGNDASWSIDNTVTYQKDVFAPSVTVNQGSSQPDPSGSSQLRFEVVFSEPVTGFTADDVVISGTAGPATGSVFVVSSSWYTLLVSGMAQSGLITVTVPAGVATDLGGNLNGASTSTDNTVIYQEDVVRPSVTVEQGATQADPTGSSSVVFDVVFSEPVIGFATGDVILSGTANATTGTVAATSSTAYTVRVTGMTKPGTVVVSVPAGVTVDVTGNSNVASTSLDNSVTFGIDTTSPPVTLNQAVGQADPTTSAPVVFDVVFSEPVTGFTSTDVLLSGSARATTASVTTVSNASYRVAVSGMTKGGTVTARIPAGAAIDAAGNANLASTSTDNTVTFDKPSRPARPQ